MEDGVTTTEDLSLTTCEKAAKGSLAEITGRGEGVTGWMFLAWVIIGGVDPLEGGERSAKTGADSLMTPPLIGVPSSAKIGLDREVKALAGTSLVTVAMVEATALTTASAPSKKPFLGILATIGASLLIG